MLPSVSEGVTDVDEGGVEVRFGREARGEEPGVPVEAVEQGGGGWVGGEEGEESALELVRVEGFAGERGEVLILLDHVAESCSNEVMGRYLRTG